MLSKIAIARVTARLPHFKGKFHLTDYFSPREGQVTEPIEGYPMCLDLADLVQRNTFMRTWEVSEVRLMKRLLRPGAVFFDVGANFGYYTAVAARRVGPEGQVFAFEPEPGIFGSLSAWVNRAAIGQVRCVRAALSDREGMLTLYVPPPSFQNHDPSVFEYCTGMEKVEVNRLTLDGFCEDNRIAHIDVLKLDVEGHEEQVLAGGEQTFRQGRVEWVLCEFNPQFSGQSGAELERLYGWFLDAGYVERTYPGGPPPFPSVGRGIPNRLFQFAGGRVH